MGERDIFRLATTMSEDETGVNDSLPFDDDICPDIQMEEREPFEEVVTLPVGGHTLGELTQGPVNPHSHDNNPPDDIGCAYVRQLTGRQTLCVE